MGKPHQEKSQRESDVTYWVHSSSSLPATPSESNFAHDAAGNWVQNQFCRDFASKIAFALVCLDHKCDR